METPTIKLLRSQHDKLIAELNTGDKEKKLRMIIAPVEEPFKPISSSQNAVHGGPFELKKVSFVRNRGYYWLETPVELIDDLPKSLGFFTLVDAELVGEFIYRIGIRTIYHNGTPFYCELRRDDMYGCYRLWAMTKADNTGRYFQNEHIVLFDYLKDSLLGEGETLQYLIDIFIKRTLSSYDELTLVS